MTTLAYPPAVFVPAPAPYDGDEIRVYLLQTNGAYALSETSLAFPAIPVRKLADFIHSVEEAGYLSAVAAVRGWVRSLINSTP